MRYRLDAAFARAGAPEGTHPAHPAPFVRHPPAGRRRRPARGPGAAGTREPRDDAGLHACLAGAPPGRVRWCTPARARRGPGDRAGRRDAPTAVTAGRALVRAGLVVTGAFFVSRVLGWVRLVVIGTTFGVQGALDPFFAAFRIPDLIFQLVAAGALESALIPTIATLLARDEQARAWRVVSTVTNLMLAGLAVLAGALFVLAPAVVPAITPGFDAAQTATTVDLTRVMLLSPIFLALGSVATSVLNARGRFAASVLAPIVYNLAIIGGALFLAPSMGVMGLAVGRGGRERVPPRDPAPTAVRTDPVPVPPAGRPGRSGGADDDPAAHPAGDRAWRGAAAAPGGDHDRVDAGRGHRSAPSLSRSPSSRSRSGRSASPLASSRSRR